MLVLSSFVFIEEVVNFQQVLSFSLCISLSIYPLLGMATIIMNDYPWVKFVLVGVLAIMVLTTKE